MEKSDLDCQTVSTQTESAMNFSDSDKNYSGLSYGSETDEDIDLCEFKPEVSEFFVKIETDVGQPVICKKEMPELSAFNDIVTRKPRVVVQRIEFPLRVPKSEPVSDGEESPMNNISQSETYFIVDSISSEDMTIIKTDESENVQGEVGSVWNYESHTMGECFMRKREKVKKRCLTISQMYKIIQNDQGFFKNKKQWMTKKVLRQLPVRDKIFLSNILKKFLKRNIFKKKKKQVKSINLRKTSVP